MKQEEHVRVGKPRATKISVGFGRRRSDRRPERSLAQLRAENERLERTRPLATEVERLRAELEALRDSTVRR